MYLVPLDFERIVLIFCYFYRVSTARFMASGRSPDMDQAGPSYAPSDPLPGKFFGLSLDIRSEKLYDLAADIPDVMGLRAVRPSVAIVRVMSVPDSLCIQVLTPDDNVNIGFHEILLHDKGEEVLPFMVMSELDYLRRIWPRALFVVMSRYQQDLECLTYQGGDCIMDFSAGGTLSPSVSDLSGPRGPYVTDGPVGHPGTLSSSTFIPEILMDLAGMLPPAMPVGQWGTLPPSVSDPTGPAGQSVTGGPVIHLGTLPSSTFELAILVDHGGTSPSFDLAGMLLPAIPGSPVGLWGTLSSSDSDPAGQDGPYGPVGHLVRSKILVPRPTLPR